MTYTDADGIQRDLSLATWNGRTVLIDDGMPTEDVKESSSGAGDGYTKYTTYVLGNGSIVLDDIGDAVPYEMSRDPKTNGGQDTLYFPCPECRVWGRCENLPRTAKARV